MENKVHSTIKLRQNEKRLLISIILVATILAGKLTAALLTKSLALFSDSWHLITDLAALVISWWGLHATNKPANDKNTYGFYRHSILTALINNISLILISLFIFYKAVERYFNPVNVQAEGMILIAILGLAVNTLIVLNLRANIENINTKSAYVHFMGDALADVGVLIGGIVIYFTGFSGVDTILSAILACLILKSACQMTIECIRIFLEIPPPHICIENVKKSLKQIEGVHEVTDIHIWSLSAEVHAMTAHVCVRERDLKQNQELLHKLQHLLFEDFGIVHSTIQFEHTPCGSCFHQAEGHQYQCSLCIDAEFKHVNRSANKNLSNCI
ncbi:cation diffusion facilitator family transporter [Dehalobacter sp. DCM]|uniref:cation diffusion facilitator family transporter n=1 Tax=Dehalobacter sp. DCM TaxID=2907827 RepID=UPI0030821864|nr:cation diffusion facilitator family transporter [Dehalobacter sp. DCM]